MKIEDGKKYITRAGEVVEIGLNKNNADTQYPFRGDNHKSYTSDGKCITYMVTDKDTIAPLYTIKDLAEGKVLVKNDGSMEDLHKVLKAAFPDDLSKARERWQFFGKRMGCDFLWGWWAEESYLPKNHPPIQSVKYFLMQLDGTQKAPQQEEQDEKEKTTIEKVAELLGLEVETAQDKSGSWIEFKDHDHSFYLEFSGDGNTFVGMALAKKEWQVVNETIVTKINKTS